MTATDVAAAEWVTCPGCRSLLYGKCFDRQARVCQNCGRHARLTVDQRVEQLVDAGSMTALRAPPLHDDPLGFRDSRAYTDRLAEARAGTGLDQGVLCALGTAHGQPAAFAVMDFRFMGGSLGTGMGEMITRTAEVALQRRVPLVTVSASGGARMQEGALSLMQMAKTSQALAALDEAGVMTVSVVTDPTYGGVAASFATLADIVIAEPGARLGFAGPRVIEQTIGQTLPPGFQTAEFLLEHGLIDGVQPRSTLKWALANLLAVQATPRRRRLAVSSDPIVYDPSLLDRCDPWETVALARNPHRPTTLDYAGYLLEGFHELHGDRASGDCPSIVGGIGWLDGLAVMLIGHQKGRTTAERAARNFGMPGPAGYRKAARLMRLAAKLGLPVLTLIDTPGAFPGVEAERSGQALAVAENLKLMSTLPVPVVTVVTGEGGSGGALALGVANRVLLSEHGVYSVITPEGCAAILWRTPDATREAAGALRLDARALLHQGVIDGVIPERGGGAHEDPLRSAAVLRDAVAVTLNELLPLGASELVADRRRRFRAFGADSCAELEELRP